MAADSVALSHFLFVVFVILGGALVWRWPRVAWLHLPCAVWGALIELGGWICPLTPLENELRRQAGEVGYRGGFVEHYLLPVLYPSGLQRSTQIVLGLLVLIVNGVFYAVAVRRWWRRRSGAIS